MNGKPANQGTQDTRSFDWSLTSWEAPASASSSFQQSFVVPVRSRLYAIIQKNTEYVQKKQKGGGVEVKGGLLGPPLASSGLARPQAPEYSSPL